MENLKKQILDAYNFRHACKKFDSKKKITDSDFEFILETARLSPSSFGFEPWKFLILQNKELREKISEAAWGAKDKLPDASHFVIILARKMKDMRYDSKYVDDFMKNVQKLPENIVQMKKGFYKEFQERDFNLLESERAIFDWSCKQTYITLGNMMIAAAEIGIDSCPIEGFHREKIENILESEKLIDRESFGVSCMVAFGYRENDPMPKTRQKIDEIVQWVD